MTMAIYFCFLGCATIVYYLFQANIFKSMRKIYCILVATFVFLLFAFRDISLGMHDVQDSYVKLFVHLADKSYSYIFKEYSSDYLFYILTKTITVFSHNINIYLAISAAPIVTAIGVLIYRYSKYPWISWIMFFTLGYFSINVTIMRQSIAMACCIFSFMKALDGEYKKAYILYIIAIGFHLTAVVSLFAILFIRFKINLNLKISFIMLTISVITLSISNIVIDFFFKRIMLERFQRYILHLSSFNTTMFAINTIQFIFCIAIFFIYDKGRKREIYHYKNRKDMSVLNSNSSFLDTGDIYFTLAIMCSLPLYALTTAFADMYRLALYFSVYCVIAIPNYLSKMPTILRMLVGTLLLCIYIYYGISSGLTTVSPYISVI